MQATTAEDAAERNPSSSSPFFMPSLPELSYLDPCRLLFCRRESLFKEETNQDARGREASAPTGSRIPCREAMFLSHNLAHFLQRVLPIEADDGLAVPCPFFC